MNYEDEYRCLAARMTGLLMEILDCKSLRDGYLRDHVTEAIETWAKLVSKDARGMANGESKEEMTADNKLWFQGNAIPTSIQYVELWLGQNVCRTAMRDNNWWLGWVYTDCTHPEQNMLVDMSKVYGWRPISATAHTASVPPDTAAAAPLDPLP